MKKLLSATNTILLLAVLIALAGCNLPVKAPITPTPVSKRLTSTAAAARTQTAQAAIKKPTQIATAAPSTTLPPPPIDTTQPTLEMAITEIVPTATVTATTTQTATATQQVTASPTAGAYKCGVTYIYPGSGTELAKGTNFTFKVTFRNDGVATWKKSAVDFRYLSGPKYQTTTDLVKLPKDVATGELVNLAVDMKVNSGSGIQNINWGLANAGALFCYVGISVVIK